VPRPGRLPSALALVAALLLALTACGGDASAKLHASELDPPFEVSSTPLTDTSGHDYSLASSTDKDLTLVFFGYTHCPDVCQTVMASLASAMTRLDQRDRDRVAVVFVTTDPARDTESVLRRYLDHFDPKFIGLTGKLDTISQVAKPLGIGITHGQKLASGGYDVTHGSTITGIVPDDEAPYYWSQDTSPAEFAADVHRLLDED